MSLFAVVFVVFLILKLLGVGMVAAWSWWMVFLPLILGAVWYVFWVAVAVWADS